MRTTKTLIPILLMGLMAGCGGEDKDKISLPQGESAAQSKPAVEVETLRVQRTETSAPLVASGTSRAVRAANLAPALSGRIERILVEEGDLVKAGQPLVRLDADTVSLSATQARAAAAAAKAQADQLQADFERLTPLAERGSIPSSRVDQLAAQRTAAKSQAQAATAAADAAARMAQNAVLRAPFAGRVVEVPVEVGEMPSMAPGAKLVRLIDLTSVEVTVPLHERDLGRVQVGDTVVATFPSLSREVEGTIVQVGYEINSATRTAEVVARFANPDESLRAGLFTEIAIQPSSSRSAMVVPKASVGGTADERFVYVVEGDTATRRLVRVSSFDRDHYEVSEGLADGELIVAKNIGRLSDGMPVTLNAEKAAAPGAAGEAGEAAAAAATQAGAAAGAGAGVTAAEAAAAAETAEEVAQ
ncbi:efflux RND transporter periplasmic adaptor subunit [Haliangium ochraceum]|nr:efflux RND transporter periplasmic adaptor subunit [Haliangium ochraceum]